MSKRIYIKPTIEVFDVDRLVLLTEMSPNSNLVGESGFIGSGRNRTADQIDGIADRSLLSGSAPKY